MKIGKRLNFENSYELAVWLHENYEEIAYEEKWNTQQSTKVNFDDLPEENKQVMLRLSERIFTGRRV